MHETPPTAAVAQSAVKTVGERPSVRAVLATESPKIDGDLDEAVWQTANVIDRFVQQEPREGQPASDRTEVRVLYDKGHLFIGVHAYASLAVTATEMRRDADRLFDEDNFQVILDTFHDSRNAYMFLTTPLGAKLEQQVFDEGEGGGRGTTSNINRNWDGVWDAAAKVVDGGWTAEISIPFSTVRFVPSDEQVWGVNFERHIRRKNESVMWAPIPKAYSLSRVSLAGELQGLKGVSRGLDLRLKPFFTGGVRDVQLTRDAGTTDALHEVGLDARYGVTAGLNLDLTYNTDFAQVEVDEQQVNLTRFGLFYPEKRDFFLENSNFFTMGTGSAFTSTQVQTDLFFSRRIGLADNGTPIPIIGGGRLAGKSGKNNIGILDIQTDNLFAKPGRQLLRRPLQPRHPQALARGRLVHQQGLGGRQRPLQPDDGRGCEPRADAEPPGHLLPGQDRDAGQGRRGHGVLRAHRVPRSEVEPLAQLPRRAGQLQCRGGLRAAHRHPDDKGLLRAHAAPEEGQRQAVRADVRPHLHHGPDGPHGGPPASPDARHHAARRLVHQRDLPADAGRARQAVPYPAHGGDPGRAPT